MDPLLQFSPDSDELALFIKKGGPRVTHVPAGSVALVPVAPSPICLPAGRAICLPPPLMIARQQPCRFSFLVTDLVSQEGLGLNLSLILVIYLDCEDVNRLESCWRYFAAKYSQVASDAIFATLYPSLCQALHEIIAGYTIEECMNSDIRERCYPLVVEKLNECLAQSGLTILAIAALVIDCPEYRQIVEQRRHNLMQEQTVAMQRRLLARQEEDRRRQIVAQHKLEQLKAKLARQRSPQHSHGEHASHLARQRARQLAQADLNALIATIDDEILRDGLYRVLSQSQISQPNSETTAGHSSNGTISSPARLLLALSNGVVQFALGDDPRQWLRLWANAPAYRFYDIPGEKLGGVRSIRAVEISGTRYLGVGAVGGVYLVANDGTVQFLSIAAATQSKHGVNALGAVGDSLYASHSDHGLLVWQIGQTSRPARSYRPWHYSSQTTRALTINGNTIYLAAGNDIYAIDPQKPDAAPLRSYQGSSSEITAMVIADDRIYAGNAAGQLLSWSLPHPAPPVCLWHSANPIYMLRTIFNDNQLQLLLGCQEYGVVAFSPMPATSVLYPADSRIRWIAGANKTVAGVSQDMRTLYLWSDKHRQGATVISTATTIKDIFMEQ